MSAGLNDSPTFIAALTEIVMDAVRQSAPNHAVAHTCLGFVQMFTNRADQGIGEYEQALALDRNLANAHALIGFAKYFLGCGAETETHIQKAFRLSPRDPLASRWTVWVGFAKVQLNSYTERFLGYAGVSKPTEIIPSRISVLPPRWPG